MDRFEYALIAVIGSLATLVILVTLPNPDTAYSQGYDPENAHLISRHVDAEISKSGKLDTERTCFVISKRDLFSEKFSREFASTLQKASNVDSRHVTGYDTAYQMQGVSFSMSSREAIGYLKHYNFEKDILVPPQHHPKNDKNQDTTTSKIRYQCFFEYDNNQYLFQLEFHPMVYPNANAGFVNITKDESDTPILANSVVTLYTSFNETVSFHNKLDRNVQLLFAPIKPIHEYRYSPNNITIPPNMYYTDRFDALGSIPYTYTIQPLNLEGSILVKEPHGKCLSMDEARSIYSNVGMVLKYPSYLPEGYKYRCTAMVTTGEVYIGYDKSDKISNDQTNLNNYGWRAGYYDDGGIVVDHWYSHVAKSECEDTFEPHEPINGIPTVYSDSSRSDDVNWNVIRSCTDSEVYEINGKLSEGELSRIMESVNLNQ